MEFRVVLELLNPRVTFLQNLRENNIGVQKETSS